jgi:hypothetical protein
MKILKSEVNGFKGECSPVWLNTSQLDNRLDGGVTGYFKLLRNTWLGKWKTGKQFHGIIERGVVRTTEGRF